MKLIKNVVEYYVGFKKNKRDLGIFIEIVIHILLFEASKNYVVEQYI